MPGTEQIYVLALGSNRGGRHGREPRAMVAAALAELGRAGLELVAISPLIDTAPIGPAQRRFANAAVVVRAEHTPPELLTLIKSIERAMGRRAGQRWGNRPIDIDIILWSGGIWQDRTLSIPHPAWRQRRFVAGPVAMLVPEWRDPVSGQTVRQIFARLKR
jgi:2-amino-4-hydroxy-6-hydroxymethyldihydropteridine diphosphokinase